MIQCASVHNYQPIGALSNRYYAATATKRQNSISQPKLKTENQNPQTPALQATANKNKHKPAFE